jgi:hypothetical protein
MVVWVGGIGVSGIFKHNLNFKEQGFKEFIP